MKTFESFLQDKFIALREVDGVPIIKDNAEDMFDAWLENKDVNDIIEYAEEAIEKATIEAKEEVLNRFSPLIDDLGKLIK